MKKFTAAETRDLFGQVVMGEISLSRMVEILNEMVSEAEEKCVEDIPKRKFQKGDRVRIREGISSKTHRGEHPCFDSGMDDLIGKTMTIKLYCDRDIVLCEKLYWQFKEEWLEPYVEELKEGDLAIFWDEDPSEALVRFYRENKGEGVQFPHVDSSGDVWRNAIKFESVEQFNRFINGEI